MKQIFIVLLIAALGAGIYFYFNKKRQNISPANSKELIVGTWKVDSIVSAKSPGSMQKQGAEWIHSFFDSSLKKYEFEFRKDSLVIQTLDDKTRDTSHYQFADEKNLLIWGRGDSVKTKWNIDKIDRSAFVVKDEDSAAFYFHRK